jgi:hypothetical protein
MRCAPGAWEASRVGCACGVCECGGVWRPNGIRPRTCPGHTKSPLSTPAADPPTRGDHTVAAAGVERRNSHSLRCRPPKARRCKHAVSPNRRAAQRPAPSDLSRSMSHPVTHHQTHIIATTRSVAAKATTRSLSCRESDNSISIPSASSVMRISAHPCRPALWTKAW